MSIEVPPPPMTITHDSRSDFANVQCSRSLIQVIEINLNTGR